MTQLTVKVGPGAKLVRQGLQNLSKEVKDVGRLGVYRTMQRIQTRMKEEGNKRDTSPINWDSDKQRKAFFATDGFGGGIPHRRTGEYQQGWRIVKTDNGYMIVNKGRAAPFVGGDAFGLVHSGINTPQQWPKFRDTVDEELKQLPEDVRAELRIAKRRSGIK